MTVEELQKKVSAAEEKVSKCQKTIERHTQQIEKKAKQLRDMGIDPEKADRYELAHSANQSANDAYWLLCDYEHKKDDIKGAQKKLIEAERICANWKEKLDLQINMEKLIVNEVPQVIKDFLQAWKEKNYDLYLRLYPAFLGKRAQLQDMVKEAKYEALRTLPEYAEYRERFGDKLYEGTYYINNPWPRKPMEAFLKEQELDPKSIKETLSLYCDSVILKMCDFSKEEERAAWLDSHLEEEKKGKLVWFYSSVSRITGPIKDAKHLYISAGDLNGVVIGEKGAAYIQTFSAGGWNIQRFHFRTRIDDVTKQYMPILTEQKQSLDSMIQSAQMVQPQSAKKEIVHSVMEDKEI